MLKSLEDLDTVVTSILERDDGVVLAAIMAENKEAWIGSYRLIEEAMRIFLLKYFSVPEDSDGVHHIRMLEAFDDEKLPLHEALGTKPRPGGLPLVPAARHLINELRVLRNLESHPTSGNSSRRERMGKQGQRIGYRAWYGVVLKAWFNV